MNAIPRLISLVRIVLTIAMLAAASTAWPEEYDPDLVQVFQLVNERLEQMDEVAAYKWVHEIDIADLDRENAVVIEVRKQAAAYGLGATSANFFAAQMEAAKLIQAQWFTAWKEKREPFPANVPDLVAETRPHLTELGDAILAQVALVVDRLHATGRTTLDAIAERELKVRYLDARNRKAIVDSLVAVTYDEHVDQEGKHLAAIRQRGVLRIGVTADYAPFAYIDQKTGQYHGIDIGIGVSIAQGLKLEPRFIRTTWPTLSADLAAGQFDIALSGITRTAQRERSGFFSLPYIWDGKTPIARCMDVARFDSLEKIDQPGVRVIVNPGGTNEEFTTSHISRAEIRRFDNNNLIFNEIAQGRADVMITDAIEVALQTQRNPALCPTMPNESLTHAAKAIFMPWDVQLKRAVDAELIRLAQNGMLNAIFNQAMMRAAQ